MEQPVSSDSLQGYNLVIRQPTCGYRFSLDALLLADFAEIPSSATVADLGTGCGVITQVLARNHVDVRCVGIESNPEMACLARDNVFRNGLSGRVDVLADDVLNVRKHFRVSSFDVVVSNPPYRNPAHGRISPKRGRDAARHETTASLFDFLSVAKYLVRPGGRIYFVYHPSRLTEFIGYMAELKLALLRLRMVHGKASGEAKIFLAELVKGRKGSVHIMAPLVVWDETGYSDEMRSILKIVPQK